jgi:putative NADPH-quinone reductase
MRLLGVYAHPKPKSFTHAVLEEFTRGLADAGHEYEVNDLYANGFDPVHFHGTEAIGREYVQHSCRLRKGFREDSRAARRT